MTAPRPSPADSVGDFQQAKPTKGRRFLQIVAKPDRATSMAEASDEVF
jgi:hypothetical protein